MCKATQAAREPGGLPQRPPGVVIRIIRPVIIGPAFYEARLMESTKRALPYPANSSLGSAPRIGGYLNQMRRRLDGHRSNLPAL
jgi:hypothetical protein